METVLSPHGKAQMGNVEARLRAGDGDDVAVVDGSTHGLVVGNVVLGDIAISAPCEGCFLGSNDADHLGVSLKRLVRLRMLTHVVDLDGLNGIEGRRRQTDLADDAPAGVVVNPVGEVMQSAGVAVQLAATIAYLTQMLLEVAVSKPLTVDAERQRRHVLDQRRAVKLARVDH